MTAPRAPFTGRSVRALLGLLVGTLALAAQEVVQIDFRNHIPGVLDAPIFYPDGVTRVVYPGSSTLRRYAYLYYSKEPKDPPSSAFFFVGYCRFQASASAGY